MTTFKVLYIDDDADEKFKIDPYVEKLTSQNLISIKLSYPERLEEYIISIQKLFPDVDAYIIDLKLGENHENKINFATYPAQILASAIRTYQSGGDKKFHEFPIFLISSDDKKKDFYDTDISSHDLFDFFISKNLMAEKGIWYEKVISSIIKAYKKISEENNLSKLLGISQEEFDSLNLFYNTDDQLISIIAQFILNEIIKRDGILINDQTLAARLGVNLIESEDWQQLISEVKKGCFYEGVYSDSYERYWAHRLVYWWEDQFPKSKPLISLTANERVELIKEKFKLNLKAANPINKWLSTKYWTICQVYKQPLDNSDGLLVLRNYEGWQDNEYVSPKGVVEEGLKRFNLRLHPIEKNRFETLKEAYRKEIYGDTK